MTKKVLIAYASKYGSTAQIADQISSVLEERGLEVTKKPIEMAADPGSFDAAILGSAVYAGQWREEAAEWLQLHADTLAERPTWLFSSGPTGEGDPAELMNGWRFPEGLKETADAIGPRDIAFFHGNIDLPKLGFGEKMIVKALKAPTGDYRDWEEIKNWARSVATAISA